MADNYEKFAKGKDQEMWKYFLRETSGESAKCLKCSAILKTLGGSTSGQTFKKHPRHLFIQEAKTC